MGDFLVYAAFRVAWLCLQHAPYGAVRRLLEGAAALAHVLDRRHREVVRDNLARAYPDLEEAARARVARGAFRSWGRMVAELAQPQAVLTSATEASLERLALRASSVRNGGPLLVLTAHIGNFELLARLMGRHTGWRVAVFHRRMKNRFIENRLLADRSRANVDTLGRGMLVREALETLRRGGIVVVPLDQNQMPHRGVFVDFFDQPACTSTLLARLSLATGVPVLPVFAGWQGEDLLAEVEAPIEPGAPTTRRDREAAIYALTERYTHAIERAVRRLPEQWNWAHRRWKTKPSPAVGTPDQGRRSGAAGKEGGHLALGSD